MKYTKQDILDFLEESSDDVVTDFILFTETYKKDDRKRKLMDDYKKTHKSNDKIVDSERQTYIRKDLSKEEGKKINKVVKIMNKDGISDKSHKAAVNIYNNKIGSPKDSSVGTTRIKHDGKTINAAHMQKKSDGKGYELSTRTFKAGKEITLKGSDKLYHTSKIDNLTELKPTVQSSDGVHYSSKRIYFYLNGVGSKIGSVKSIDDLPSGTHVYELMDKPKVVRQDTELGGNAVYIDTDKPIKVKKIK